MVRFSRDWHNAFVTRQVSLEPPPGRPIALTRADSEGALSGADESEPSLILVIEVGLAKLHLQNLGFPMRSKHMHGHQ
jgi:hypothetical protein